MTEETLKVKKNIQFKSKPPFEYINSFDGLRAFATLSVLCLHGSYGFIRGGWIGVDLFFVLSGFLITSLLQAEYLKTGTISFSKFYLRRFLRLFPPLLVCILLANLLWSHKPPFPGGNQLWATAGALFYFTNLIQGSLSGNMAHLWSLSVEEHFYFLWPILTLLFFFKITPQARIIFLVALFVLVAVSRILVFNYQNIFSFDTFTINSNRFTFCRIDGIVLGSLLAFLHVKKPTHDSFANNKKNTGIILLFLFVFIILLLTLDEDNKIWRNGGFILTDLFCFFTVYIAIKNPKHFLLSNNVVSWLGKRSYGIYVYHFPIFLVLEKLREPHSVSNFVFLTMIKFILSIIFAAASYKYLELPVLKLKKRFEVQKINSQV